MKREGNSQELDVKGIFLNLPITAETLITLVPYHKKPSSGDPRSWPIMNAGDCKWDNIMPKMAKLTASPRIPEGKLVISPLELPTPMTAGMAIKLPAVAGDFWLMA